MTPKSLLRHELSVSPLEDLDRRRVRTRHRRDRQIASRPTCARVVLCSGKVYFDLLKARRATSMHDVALVRVEQLYPFPVRRDTQAVLAQVSECARSRLVPGRAAEPGRVVPDPPSPAATARSASANCCTPVVRRPRAPATGITKLHEAEQRGSVEAALTRH